MTRPARSHAPRHWRPADAHLYAAWGAVLLAFVLSIGWLLTKGTDDTWRWFDGAFIFLISFMSVFAAARRFPVQNIVPAALIILATSAVAIATFAYYVSDPSSTPKVGFNDDALGFKSNDKLLLPLQVPFLILAMTLSSRETTRLMLRPWRREKNYGLWLLGISTLLVLFICVAMEPFANKVATWWNWQRNTSNAYSWHGAPWWAFVCWGSLALVVYWFAGPWLIVKRPLSMIPDLSPAGVWLLLLAYFTLGNATKLADGLWQPVIAAIVAAIPVSFMAWRGWKLSQPPVTPAPVPASSSEAA
ncbi:MAG: hypothetical protein ACP5MD_06830, partial [Verrucomicrobiia bacterium]